MDNFIHDHEEYGYSKVGSFYSYRNKREYVHTPDSILSYEKTIYSTTFYQDDWKGESNLPIIELGRERRCFISERGDRFLTIEDTGSDRVLTYLNKEGKILWAVLTERPCHSLAYIKCLISRDDTVSIYRNGVTLVYKEGCLQHSREGEDRTRFRHDSIRTACGNYSLSLTYELTMEGVTLIRLLEGNHKLGLENQHEPPLSRENLRDVVYLDYHEGNRYAMYQKHGVNGQDDRQPYQYFENVTGRDTEQSISSQARRKAWKLLVSKFNQIPNKGQYAKPLLTFRAVGLVLEHSLKLGHNTDNYTLLWYDFLTEELCHIQYCLGGDHSTELWSEKGRLYLMLLQPGRVSHCFDLTKAWTPSVHSSYTQDSPNRDYYKKVFEVFYLLTKFPTELIIDILSRILPHWLELDLRN